jgi:hypothetical protein
MFDAGCPFSVAVAEIAAVFAGQITVTAGPTVTPSCPKALTITFMLPTEVNEPSETENCKT